MLILSALWGCGGPQAVSEGPSAEEAAPTSPDMGLNRAALVRQKWSVIQVRELAKHGDRIYLKISGRWAGRYYRPDAIRPLAEGPVPPIHEGLRIGPHWAIRRGDTLTVIDVRGNLNTYFTVR
ncbi:MAG: hypothetical protein R3236_03840 [Phycisphaeraceae bacterium]|nr:hypothetical protein [Phycisphaeraceae bacterium]